MTRLRTTTRIRVFLTRLAGHRAAMEQYERMMRTLVADGEYLAAGVAQIGPDGAEQAVFHGRQHPHDAPGALDTGLRMRCASITKAATARLACELAVSGRLDLGTDAATVLAAIPQGITFDMLLSHTSGLTDAGGYLTQPGTPPTVLVRPPRTPPGLFFCYANLNYMVLGAAFEAITGDRLDRGLRDLVLTPAGISGGLNWAGVSDRRPVPLYQRHGNTHTLEVDGTDADWSADLILTNGGGHDLSGYVPGRDTVLMSPHAGLRLSLPEMARLARHIGADSPAGRLQREILWRSKGGNGDGSNGLFPAVGRGVMHATGGSTLIGPLVGHGGRALGFAGGVWYNPHSGTAHAFAMTGADDGTSWDRNASARPDDALPFLRMFGSPQ